MAKETDSQTPTGSPTGLPASAGSPLRSDCLTVGDLRKAIEGLPDDWEIFCQAGSNDLGHIWSPHALDRSTYGFFGSQIPCLIINHSQRDSEMGILWRVGQPDDQSAGTAD